MAFIVSEKDRTYYNNYINTVQQRVVVAAAKIRPNAKSMWDKIQNPVTGRYVKVTGRVGRRVIKRYLKELENKHGGAFQNQPDIPERLGTHLTNKAPFINSPDRHRDFSSEFVNWSRENKKQQNSREAALLSSLPEEYQNAYLADKAAVPKGELRRNFQKEKQAKANLQKQLADGVIDRTQYKTLQRQANDARNRQPFTTHSHRMRTLGQLAAMTERNKANAATPSKKPVAIRESDGNEALGDTISEPLNIPEAAVLKPLFDKLSGILSDIHPNRWEIEGTKYPAQLFKRVSKAGCRSQPFVRQTIIDIIKKVEEVVERLTGRMEETFNPAQFLKNVLEAVKRHIDLKVKEVAAGRRRPTSLSLISCGTPYARGLKVVATGLAELLVKIAVPRADISSRLEDYIKTSTLELERFYKIYNATLHTDTRVQDAKWKRVRDVKTDPRTADDWMSSRDYDGEQSPEGVARGAVGIAK